MLQAFRDYTSSTRLFSLSDRILLAVSGGVDSMAMVKLFSDAGFNFGIAHFNFGLRGTESDLDEQFVTKTASDLGVELFIKRIDTAVYAKSKKVSIQMAARELRYNWFEQICQESGYNYIATAHHLDDQAETFFINLLRGTGIGGMHGILPKQGKIIRPLMFTTRDAILQYARENEITWREDQSNKNKKYLRNKLRHDILTEFHKINPQFSQKLNETIIHLRDVESVYNTHMAGVTADLVQQTSEGIVISIDWVYEYQPHDTYLYELLKPYGFTFPVVKEIVRSLDTFSGKIFYSSTHRLLRDRENFIIQSLSELKTEQESEEDFQLERGVLNIQYPVCICTHETDQIADLPMGKASIACLDMDKLKFPLTLRKWEKGDWFMPLGLKGKKKLSDFFVDQKLSLAEKEKIWLLVSGKDIVWVIGKRIDNRFRITPSTKKAYVLTSVDDSGETETYSCGCSLLFG